MDVHHSEDSLTLLDNASPQDAVRAAAIGGGVTILDLFDSLPFFRENGKLGESWAIWRAVLAAGFGLPMSPAEVAIYRECTGRTEPPTKPAREVSVVVGRRGGKSRVIGSVVVPYFALFRDYSKILGAGERATILVLAKDKDDAKAILGYCKATFGLRSFKGFVESDNTEGLTLNNGVDITIRAAKITAARSRTVPCACLDEIAYWPNEDAAEPDEEILRGIRPAQVTVPNAMIWKLSSPYAERGSLWEDYDKHWGKENDRILVWKAPTLRMNPANPVVRAEVEQAYREDPVSAAAEYGAEFRQDVQVFVTREAVRAATSVGVRARPVISNVRYFAFVDPSGGSSDDFTLAIGHWDHTRQRSVLDVLEYWPAPFKDEHGKDVGPHWLVTNKIVPLLKPFGVVAVTGDAYAGHWPREPFLEKGITYNVSDRPKARIYVDFLPLLNSKTADLLDNPKLEAQLVGLDRRTARGGRDSIDHRPGAHDDLANAAAGALVLASEQGRYIAPHEPERQFLTPEGKPDYLALRAEENRLAWERARNPREEEIEDRYRYMR